MSLRSLGCVYSGPVLIPVSLLAGRWFDHLVVCRDHYITSTMSHNCHYFQSLVSLVTSISENAAYIRFVDLAREGKPPETGVKHDYQLPMNERFDRYLELIPNADKMAITADNFRRAASKLDKMVEKKNTSKKATTLREILNKHYTLAKWFALSQKQRSLHSHSQCKGCENDAIKRDKLEEKWDWEEDIMEALRRYYDNYASSVRALKTESSVLRDILELVDDAFFRRAFGKSCFDCIFGLSKKKVSDLKKSTERAAAASLVTSKEEDVHVMMMNNHSFSQAERLRFDQSFTLPATPAEPSRNAKDSVGDLKNYSVDEGLFDAFWHGPVGPKHGDDVNWTEVGRMCDIRKVKDGLPVADNSLGSVLKKWCRERKGIDPLAFNIKHILSGRDVEKRVRRIKKRMPEGTAVPSRSNKSQLKQGIEDMKENGALVKLQQLPIANVVTKYRVGPCGDNNQIGLRKVTINEPALMYPLKEAIFNGLKNSYEKGTLKILNEEQVQALSFADLEVSLKSWGEWSEDLTLQRARDRFIKFNRAPGYGGWHDNGLHNGQSGIFFCSKPLWDLAIYSAGSQAKVETPTLHIMGHEDSSVSTLLKFSSHRLEQIQSVKSIYLPFIGVTVHPRIRCYFGDSKAAQAECGTQSGGHFRCTNCPLRASDFANLGLSLNFKNRSMEDIQKVANAGVVHAEGEIISRNLSAEQMERECRARGLLNTTSSYTANKDVLTEVLVEDTRGVQRVPSLLHGLPPDTSLEDVGLGDYEPVGGETMHDASALAKICMTEIPHLDENYLDAGGELKDFCTEIMKTEGSHRLRAADARLKLIHVTDLTNTLYQADKLPSKDVLLLCLSLVEMIQIAYALDELRTPQLIYRFNNRTLCFAILLLEIVEKNGPKSANFEAMFGLYFHHFVSHAPRTLRLFSLRSVMAEREESLIWEVRTTTRKTSSGRPGETIENAMMRQIYVAENRVKEKHSRYVGKHADGVDLPGHTLLPAKWLKQGSWQRSAVLAHLKRISDYLLLGENISYVVGDRGSIMLLDCYSEAECPIPVDVRLN